MPAHRANAGNLIHRATDRVGHLVRPGAKLSRACLQLLHAGGQLVRAVCQLIEPAANAVGAVFELVGAIGKLLGAAGQKAGLGLGVDGGAAGIDKLLRARPGSLCRGHAGGRSPRLLPRRGPGPGRIEVGHGREHGPGDEGDKQHEGRQSGVL